MLLPLVFPPISPGLSLLLLSLLLARAGVWGFPRPPGKLSQQELRREFKISLRLASKLFSEIRGQAQNFADSHLPGMNLDFLPLGEKLPNVSLTFQAWRNLSDADRLYFLSMTLRPFHALLEELENQGLWNKEERKRLWTARLDLRDLQWHLHFQPRILRAFPIPAFRTGKASSQEGTQTRKWGGREKNFQARDGGTVT